MKKETFDKILCTAFGVVVLFFFFVVLFVTLKGGQV